MKYLFIVPVLTIASHLANSQIKKLPDPKPSFFAIIVSDIDRSIQWYSENLGFDILNRIELEERGLKQANLKRGNTSIELIQLSSAISQVDLLSEQPHKNKIHGFFKFGFSVGGFDDWIKFLNESNVEFTGSIVKDQISGKRMVIVKDPDGNRIQLFEE